MRPIPDIAVDFIAGFEGIELTAYKDIAGIWTIGYGHTGPEVKQGMTITRAKAKAYLKDDLSVAANRIKARVSARVLEGLTDSQYAALLSFVYNLGANPSWTIWKVLNAGNLEQVPAQIVRFNKARVNGQLTVVRGLARRRAAEVDLWNQEVGEEVRVSGRNVETPPVDNATKPLAQSRTLVSGAVSAVAAGSAGVMQVQQTLEPAAHASDTMGKIVAGLAIAGALLALIIVVLKWLDHKNAKK